VLPTEFKRQQIDRVLRGGVAVAELDRELKVSRALIQRRKHLFAARSDAAVAARANPS